MTRKSNKPPKYIPKLYQCNKHRITAAMKVEKDIIASIQENPIGQAVMQVIIYVKNFKTSCIVLPIMS